MGGNADAIACSAKVEFSVTTQPDLIAHIHVPKTAGTTINAALAHALGPGRDHIQPLLSDPGAFAAVVAESRWIAGHVPLPRMQAALRAAGVTARYVTALRKPVSHVASHYNWLIEIGHRGRAFLQGHPPEIRDMHHQIAASDNSDPLVVIRNLETYTGLFLNCQARHVIGPQFALAETSFADGLGAYDSILFPNDIRAGLSRLLPGQSFAPAEKNASRYHFDPRVFTHPALRLFLRDRNRADEALWTIARARFPSAQQEIAA